MTRPGKRFRHQGIKEPGADAPQDAEHDSLARIAAALRDPLVGKRIEHDGNAYQRDAGENEQRIACRRDDVVQHCTQHQGQPGADGKRYRHAGDGDRIHDQDVAHTEDRSPGKRQPYAARAGRLQVEEHAIGRCGMQPAQGKRNDHGAKRETDGVVEVEKLKEPLPGELLSIRPSSPAQHAQGHEKERGGVAVWSEHVYSFWRIQF